jgi:predicted membrane channel-forming protein YqfA (hemolysin III family)
MKLGAEKSMRLIAAQLATSEGWQDALRRAIGLCFEPGATLDSLMLQQNKRHADAATMSLYLLPAAATFITAVLSLSPAGVLAMVLADLLAVAMLPTLLALSFPPLSLLFDIGASANRYRWRTFVTHALVPILVATALARLLQPFSGGAAFVALVFGYANSARLFYLCCDDWVAVPEQRRLQATATFVGLLLLISAFSALLLRAGLVP